jgi:hypothetical protein
MRGQCFFNKNFFVKHLFLSITHNDDAYLVMSTALQCLNS